MSITFQLLIGAVIVFIVLNSLLTVIFGTISWLVDKFGWKMWIVIGLVVVGIGYLLYDNFGDMFGWLLQKIQ